ncbi:MAG TPA: hypothetical protein VHD83_15160, partial [Puia sp.]|nr:hypothetical protein [Puia sp.]
MKKALFTHTALISCLVLCITTGCKKNNDSNSADSVSAVVAGASWKSDRIKSYENFGTLGANNGYILIDAYYGKGPGDTSIMELVIDDTAHAGLVDHFHCASFALYTSTPSIYGLVYGKNTHGTITVTSWDKNAHTIAGTFDGVIYNVQTNVDDSIQVDN